MAGKSRAQQALELRESAATPSPSDPTAPRYFKLLDRQAHDYALLGASNTDIATLLQIKPETVDLWMVEHKSFAAAIGRGREGADVKVAKALFRRATGMKVRKEKAFNVNGDLQTIEITEDLPPDVTAQMAWLTNRQGAKWRNGKTVEHTGQISLSALVESSYGDDAKVIEATPVKEGGN